MKGSRSPYQEPSVAAIVVNWNSGDLLGRCVSSLSHQSLPPNRIIVVDNATTDGSSEHAQERYPELQVIPLSENLGFAAANNFAIAQLSDCEWVALVNPDAFVESDWLERMMEAAQRNPGYAFFGSRLLSVSERGKLDGAGDVYHVSGRSWRRGHGEREEGRYQEPEEMFSVCAAATLYRRDAFLRVGGFDESYFGYFEDTDLAFRLRLAGYRGLYVPNAVVHHVGSATTGKGSDFSVYHGHRNLVWTYFKDMPWPLFWLYLPQHVLLNLVSIFWFALHGRGEVILKAKWDALKGLLRVLRQRREVQKTRRVDAWEVRRLMAKGLLTPYLRWKR